MPSQLFNQRSLIVASIGLGMPVGAAIGYFVGDVTAALMFAIALPAPVLVAIWSRRYLRQRDQRAADRTRKTAQLALLNEICRNDMRRAIRDRYAVVSRYADQYDPDRAQRELIERVTHLYRAKDNASAEALLDRAREQFAGSPYVAARHARMLLQDLRIEEARIIINGALTTNPDEISLLILRDGVARADRGEDQDAVKGAIQVALAEMVEWASMQLELIVGRTRDQLREQLDVMIH